MSRPTSISILLYALAPLAAGCSSTSGDAGPPPTVQLVSGGPARIEVRISGSDGLRALQGTLIYDAAAVAIAEVTAGGDAARIDRVFSTPPDKAAGRLVVGLTDTRRVKLPASGSLLWLRLSAPPQADTALRLAEIVGVREGGRPVELADAALELSKR